MNIKQAKEEIRHMVQAYLAKDETGSYVFPVLRQRPVFLYGPPGIGKTQVMEQVARECGIGLVSYTITHHTRQSAVGLPFIRDREFQGNTYSVTEYTMSEIIGSVYEKMETTGLREGILFIDEINCVSETLAPTMLQFLQRKMFGNQKVPQGWLIVAAGNPPEYNKSVREFDLVTLDRVRTIPVEADYSVWKEYAREQRLHGALLGYLELRPKNFYRIEADVDGMQYVTARGWEDFSHLLCAYERMGLAVTEETVYEYLHHRDVAQDVAAYVDLYRKYQDDYGIGQILAGKVKSGVYARIEAAGFDERLCVVNLLTDGLMVFFAKVQTEKNITDRYFSFLKEYRAISKEHKPDEEYDRLRREWEDSFDRKRRADLSGREEEAEYMRLFGLLKENRPKRGARTVEEAFSQARAGFERQRRRLEEAEEAAGVSLECAFDFMEQAFSQGEEMVVFVTELTVNRMAAAFLAEHPCERYFNYSKELLIGSKKRELLSELKR